MNDKPQTISLPTGGYLAYHRTEGAEPGVIFMGGFMSDMTGSKATAIEAWAKKEGRAFLRFDYEGHGESSGRFEEGTIGRWLSNALFALDNLTSGKQVIVGSSMGGWIMLLSALKRTERIAALVGIASAPDFTHELIMRDLSADQRKDMTERGYIEIPQNLPPARGGEQGGAELGASPPPNLPPQAGGGTSRNYIITRELIEESSKHLLMSYDEITLDCPVRLIHGMKDADVPWTTTLRISEKLISHDVQVILDKEGDHRMSGEREIRLLQKSLSEVIDVCPKSG